MGDSKFRIVEAIAYPFDLLIKVEFIVFAGLVPLNRILAAPLREWSDTV